MRFIEAKGINKIRGLMFRKKKINFVFRFDKEVNHPIHSLFVFYTFRVYFYNDNRLVDKKKVKPFTLSVKSKEPYTHFYEIPI